MSTALPEALGTHRFDVVRHLGTGGMGAVFEALDRERGAKVALKTLRAPSPDALLYLKNEFRALQDVRHPNLANLLELIEDAGRWFVTMELVHGVDFLAYTRPGWTDVSVSGLTETAHVGGAPASRIDVGDGEGRASGSEEGFDEPRLRDALGQLALGLAALHDAGKVHRDVKPSNVLVTSEGRVVLVDFGLAASTVPGEKRPEGRGVGTRAFMAPEQAAGAPASSTADWYSVGVVLYLALTGELPFHGADMERRRAHESPLAVRDCCPGAPLDLATLASDLLQLDPAARPSGRDVLRRLGRSQAEAAAATPFVGRNDEVAAIQQALADSAKQSITTVVMGDSGVGKSALVREVLARLEATGSDALVLTGRCYERELVPYKAFDGIIDALSHFLRRQGPAHAARLLPRDAAILARVFPTLRRVPALVDAHPPPIDDPHEQRALAFSALRSLFAAIAAERPVLLFIDDLQWADGDSHLLLADLLRPPGAPPLCLVATARPPAPGAPDRIGPWLDRLDRVRRISLAPLSRDEALRLAAAALGPASDEDLASAIAAETAGHPLFVLTLAHHARTSPGLDLGALRLDDALWARVEGVDEPARRMLELIAVAGAPLLPTTAARAAGVDHASYAASSSTLRVARLVRTTTEAREGQIEPYHDRVRETVLARLDADRRQVCHLRLADAMEATGGADHDPQGLVRHLEGAGQSGRAARQAELAASRAIESLAFDQAAELFRTALRLGTFDGDERQKLLVKLAEALTNAGRAAEASATLLECASAAPPEERLEYRRRAADHMLRSGHLEEGMGILSDVLRELGESIPSQRRALFATLGRRLRTRFRGLAWTPRPAGEAAPEALRKIDAFHAVGVSLALIDPVRGSTFEARAVALALDAGDPIRLGPCLAMEAGYQASVGAKGLARGRRLIEEVQRIVELTQDPYVTLAGRLMDGFLDYHAGAFDRAARHLGEVDREFRHTLPGTYFEQAFCHCFRLICLRNRGQLGELQRGFFEWVRDAERRGDRFTEASIRFNLNSIWLARDEPEDARRDLERTTWIPPKGGYHVQHWYEQLARAEIDLYERAGEAGLLRFRPVFAQLSRSFILRMHLHRCIARWLLGKLVVGAARTASRPGPLLGEVERLALQLSNEPFGFARTYSLLLRSAVAFRRGDHEGASRVLEEAIRKAEEHDLPQCAAAARYRLGALLGDARGRALIDTARVWMQEQQIRSPERMIEVWAPGFD